MSIFETIKKDLGVAPSIAEFDDYILICMNSALDTLRQTIGESNFVIFKLDASTNLDELFTPNIYESASGDSILQLLTLQTKLIFDPPANSFLVDSIEKKITELSWRLNVDFDKTND